MTKKYRTYLIILSSIPSRSCDEKFGKYIIENKFDYWRYTALNWIVLTPLTVSTNQINTEVFKAYGPVFITCLEIDINDVAGLLPSNKENFVAGVSQTPFVWFDVIKSPKFVPRWEKEKEKTESKK